MRIRWKILLILLSISLVPIVVMRWNGQRSIKNMGNDLALRARNVLSRRASLELKSLVEEHATILRRERDLVEMALQVQASELEKRLSRVLFKLKLGLQTSIYGCMDECSPGRYTFPIKIRPI
jgi:sigma-B regulation protein RsbU (phosphoserine phosphatase)